MIFFQELKSDDRRVSVEFTFFSQQETIPARNEIFNWY